jgi:hypothetical protein
MKTLLTCIFFVTSLMGGAAYAQPLEKQLRSDAEAMIRLVVPDADEKKMGRPLTEMLDESIERIKKNMPWLIAEPEAGGWALIPDDAFEESYKSYISLPAEKRQKDLILYYVHLKEKNALNREQRTILSRLIWYELQTIQK